MHETYESIAKTLAEDEVLLSLGARAWLTLAPLRESEAMTARFPVAVYPLGVSQTAGAGELKADGHFAITVRSLGGTRLPADGGRDFLTVGERIVALLHRSRHAGQSVVFSKNITAHSSFQLQVTNRRILIAVAQKEVVQALFFWTNAAAVEDLERRDAPEELFP